MPSMHWLLRSKMINIRRLGHSDVVKAFLDCLVSRYSREVVVQEFPVPDIEATKGTG